MSKTINVGRVTSYADAVAGGYQGTREEWKIVLANLGTTAAEVEANRQAVAEDKAAVEGDVTTVGEYKDVASAAAAAALQSAESAHTDALAATAAKEAAQTAQGIAEEAKADAVSAKTAAESAQTEADVSASAAAGSALAANNAAQTAAEQAGAAAAAAETAQNVLDSIPEDYTELSEAVNDISDYTAINLVDEKNLLNITDAVYSDGWYSFKAGDARSVYGTDSFPHREIKPLTRYTLSFDGKYDGSAATSLIVRIKYTDGTKTDAVLNSPSEKHYAVTSDSGKTISAINYSYNNNVQCYLKSLMMVEGTSEPSEFVPYDQRTAVDETARAAAQNAEATAEAVETMHRGLITYKPRYNMELGNISYNRHPWEYPASTSRVRLIARETLPLMAGDVISVGNDSGIRYYLGWIDREGSYGEAPWRYDDYVVTADGEYSILLRYEPEVTISNIEDITSKITITRGESIYNGINTSIELNKRHDYFVKSINHRGYSRYAPENSLLAFKLSSYLGFGYVETDVRFTSDGVPVLLHDESINSVARNVDGTAISETVNIADITYEQALEYDFGLYKGGQFAGTKIATFEDFLKLCRALSIKPYIEIKDETGTKVADMVGMAKRCGIIDRCTWIAFSYTALQKVAAAYSKARLGLVGGYTANTIATLQSLKTTDNDVFCDAPSTITDEAITALIDAGFPVEVYTPNNIDNIRALDPYISGVTSDYWIAGEILRGGAMDGVI